MLFLLLVLMVAFALCKDEPLKDNHASGMEFHDTKRQQAALWRSLKHWIKEGELKNTMNCNSCLGVLQYLQHQVALDGDDKFVLNGKALCNELEARYNKPHWGDVCRGVVEEHGMIFANALRRMDRAPKSQAAKIFCNRWMSVCLSENPKPTVALTKPKRERRRPEASGKKPIRIVHFSDIYVDPEYVEGARTVCDHPVLCCRLYGGLESLWDEKNKHPAGPYGHPRTCDTPPLLEESMYRAIRKQAPDAAFSIFTGNIIGRQAWKSSPETNAQQIQHAYGNMSHYLNVVYGVVGNHESSPMNSFPFGNISESYSQQWLYERLSADWSTASGSIKEEEVKAGGRYSTKVPGRNLRIITINTNFYYSRNLWLYRDPIDADPDGQLKWLANELDAAEEAEENVWILGHMAMGDGDVMLHASHAFNQILERYSGTIAAMFFGHTHMDQFQINYTNKTTTWDDGSHKHVEPHKQRNTSNAIVTSYIAPSLTPSRGNPAFRIYDVDPETFGVLDMTTYMADMKDKSFQTGPVWKKYYSAKEAYGRMVKPPLTDPKAELTAGFWHNLVWSWRRHSKKYNKYYAHRTRGVKPLKKKKKVDRWNEKCWVKGGLAEQNCISDTVDDTVKKEVEQKEKEKDKLRIKKKKKVNE